VVTRKNFDKYAEAPPWVLSLPNRSLLAVWSEQLPQGQSGWAGDYLYTSASSDQGKTWSEPAIVHSDRTNGEHSFVSLAVQDDSHATIVWLDSRDYDTKHTYRLMSAVIGSSGVVSDEQTVDDDVCTCCPTALVKTTRGFVAAYRNHTPQEIRDIYTVREESGAWKTGRPLHNDNWNINGCPVNGAALARRGEEVVAVWYSGMEERASVQVEFSPDGGATFADNMKIDSPQEKEQPIGRPTVALLGPSDALVAWIRRQNDQSQLVVAQVRRNESAIRRQIIAEGSTEGLGYPRMQLIGSDAVISWGGAGDSKEVKTALIARR
ncbi:MAG: sialidase family protein, partial [Terriglobales bacterium]